MAGVSLLFITCGESETGVLPSTGTYRVNALVGKSSLDECSIISEKDTIRPFFSNFVTNDPDITGLMVFLQTPAGQIIGGKVQYTLKPVEPAAKTGLGTKTDDKTTGTDPEKEQLPGQEASTEADSITLIHVTRLDRELPYFSLPKNLKAGQYTLVFQILGEKEVLNWINQPVYYIGGAAFTLDDIQSYPPGISTGSHLIPPGLTIMLETQVTAGEGLDPYVVWYNGKKRIYEGSMAGGAGRFLWKAPDQTGFHTLRVEAFPFKPTLDLKGAIRELSLPVSAKNENTGVFSQKAEQFSYWYQFAGNLRDSKAPEETSRELTVQRDHLAQWLPSEGMYGLSIGPDDVYQLPLSSFIRSGEERGGGQFLLRFKPVAGGSVFTALFKEKYSSRVMLDMNLSAKDGGLILGLTAGGVNTSIPIFSASFGNDAFITVGIEFSIEASRFTVSLSLENSGITVFEPVSIPLSNTLSGEGTFALGGPGESAKGTKNNEPVVTAIFDEFAAMHQVAPFLGKEKSSTDAGESS